MIKTLYKSTTQFLPWLKHFTKVQPNFTMIKNTLQKYNPILPWLKHFTKVQHPLHHD